MTTKTQGHMRIKSDGDGKAEIALIDVEQEMDPVAFDTEPTREEPSKPANEPIATNGKPVTVTDATFEAVVLEAELPVVLEFWAVW